MSTSDFTPAERDAAAARIAAEQHGVLTTDQLLACGFTDDTIHERRHRTLWPVGPGVYALGHPGIGRRGRAAAALLRVGPAGGVSHDSAARVWRLERASTDGPVHVSAIGRPHLPEMPGMVFHRPPSLVPADLVEHRSVRLTTPERTVIDLLPTRTEAEIGGLLEQWVTVLGRSPDAIHDWAHGLGPVSGRRKLIRALDDVAGPAVIRSELEELFREVCRESSLPMPQTNVRIAGAEFDAAWLDYLVAVELDSWRFHGGRWQFHRDREKGLLIARVGFQLIRLTWKQLKRDRAYVIDTLAVVLQRAAQTPPTTTRQARTAGSIASPAGL